MQGQFTELAGRLSPCSLEDAVSQLDDNGGDDCKGTSR